MNVLGIESSCDETAAAVVQDGRKILSSVVSSQVQLHKPYFGVVPELASRAHVLVINDVIDRALGGQESTRSVDAVAVTVGPGLAGALLVGKMTAQALGWVRDLPVVGVNHIEGHLLSPLLSDPGLKPPFLGLVVSGGHTDLIVASKWGEYQWLGRTRDDAAGEAFDKVARMLRLEYPGGPIVDRLAKLGTASRFPFPRAWLPGTWDFSFSGLKTAVLYKLRERKVWPKQAIKDLCAGFQESVVDVLVQKTVAAAHALKVKTIVVGGGVAANSLLRQRFQSECRKQGFVLSIPPLSLCTDNAAMIAAVGYFKLKRLKTPAPNELKIAAQIHVPLYKRPLRPFHPRPSAN